MAKEQKLAQERTESVGETVKTLLPLYDSSKVDGPSTVTHSAPSAKNVIDGLKLLVSVMFPGRDSSEPLTKVQLDKFLSGTLENAWKLLQPEIACAIPYRWQAAAARSEEEQTPDEVSAESNFLMGKLFERLSFIREVLIEDVQAAYDGDPAALSYAEVKLAYPGLLAITSHRIAHELYLLDVPIVPRIMSEWTHTRTGVDIHPGAQIGRGFFIDHATGVVIGETSVIGDRVKLYQGVTIGAKSFPLDENGLPIKHIQRHPTVEDNVVVYANATILGGDTVVGARSTVGGNVFLTESVPPDSMVSRAAPDVKIRSSN